MLLCYLGNGSWLVLDCVVFLYVKLECSVLSLVFSRVKPYSVSIEGPWTSLRSSLPFVLSVWEKVLLCSPFWPLTFNLLGPSAGTTGVHHHAQHLLSCILKLRFLTDHSKALGPEVTFLFLSKVIFECETGIRSCC